MLKGIKLKTAIVTGCTGQDGSYLVENLLDKGYKVYGIVRRVSTPNLKNIQHLLGFDTLDRFFIEEGDITDLASLIRIFKRIQPNEIYNLAAQTFVAVSWDQPILTSNVTGLGALNVFEAARQVCPKARIYQASSSEMFDGVSFPQNEETPLKPRSPYGVSKLFAHEMARIYRESFGMFIACGILFNHESPRRGIEFVTQKVVDTVVRQIEQGEDVILELGNLEAKRDWSHAEDMVQGMWLMLQNAEPKDYVLASGETHSIFEFVNKVYEYFDINVLWATKDRLPIGYSPTGKVLVKSVEKFYRPNEVCTLQGDSLKSRKELLWEPENSFDDLIGSMIAAKLEEHKK